MFVVGATVKNKHTSDMRTIVEIDVVNVGPHEKTDDVFVLDIDLSRWNSKSMREHWEVVHMNTDYLYGVDYKVAEPSKEDLLLDCDLCGGEELVGFVDKQLSFKVCRHCDVDGSDFNPKLWDKDTLAQAQLESEEE